MAQYSRGKLGRESALKPVAFGVLYPSPQTRACGDMLEAQTRYDHVFQGRPIHGRA